MLRPQFVLVPLRERRAVEPHRAQRRRPDADQQPCQRRFARGAWADHAHHLARVDGDAEVLQDHLLRARHGHRNARRA